MSERPVMTGLSYETAVMVKRLKRVDDLTSPASP
jgi:hypothetical protein